MKSFKMCAAVAVSAFGLSACGPAAEQMIDSKEATQSATVAEALTVVGKMKFQSVKLGKYANVYTNGAVSTLQANASETTAFVFEIVKDDKGFSNVCAPGTSICLVDSGTGTVVGQTIDKSKGRWYLDRSAIRSVANGAAWTITASSGYNVTLLPVLSSGPAISQQWVIK